MTNRRIVAFAGAFALAIALCAACKDIVGLNPDNSAAALFDQVWSDFDQHYSLFVVKKINWDSLRTVYRPRALAATTIDGTSAQIARMLGKLQDDHVVFRGSRVGTSPHGGGFEEVNPSQYVQYGDGFSDGLYYGTVRPTIGYLNIPTFEGTNWLPEVDSALKVLGGMASIIIDVRNNDGGFLENATSAAGRFADRNASVAYVRYRNGPAHTDFTSPIVQEVSPAGARHFLGKIVLLTDRNTISAAELFVLSMRALGRTTVVGDTTAGETGSPFARELQNGWSYQFPESIEYTLDMKTFEDIGLPPDVYVLNALAASSAPNDLQLQRAIGLAIGIHN
jgi:carboxyl-terminal processing protease